MLSAIRSTLQRVNTPESMTSFSPLSSIYTPTPSELDPLDIECPQPRFLPSQFENSPESSSLLFPMDCEYDTFPEVTPYGLYESPFPDTPSSTSPAPSSSPQLGRRSIPLPPITPPPSAEEGTKKLLHLNQVQAAMAGIAISHGDHVSNAVTKVSDYTIRFLTNWLASQEMKESDNSDTPSSPPSYQSKKRSLDHPGPGWVFNTRPKNGYYEPIYVINDQGYNEEATYVKYDLTPSYPQVHATQGKDRKIFSHPLRPARASLRPDQYTERQARLFSPEEAFEPWVNEALKTEDEVTLKAGVLHYRYLYDEERAIRAQLADVQRTLDHVTSKKTDALELLEAANAFERINAQIVWQTDNLRLPARNPGALSTWREVAGRNVPTRVAYPRTPSSDTINQYCRTNHPTKADHVRPLRHTSLPHAHACNLRKYLYQQEQSRVHKRSRKQCHRCKKWGHIRATCPSRQPSGWDTTPESNFWGY